MSPVRRRNNASPPTGSAKSAALALLGRRDYSARELQDRLGRRGHTAEDIHSALSNLRDRGLIDDARVAAAHVRTAARIKGRGRHRIERELLARGIDRSTAHAAVAALSAADEPAAIAKILQRRRTPATLDPAARRRLFQHLLRRGFSADAIKKVLGGMDEDQ